MSIGGGSGIGGGGLKIALRLAEIAAAGAAAQATARTNLGIGSTGTVQFNYLGLGVARTVGRLQIVSGTTAGDGIYWGSDVNLYRSGADILFTDDNFSAAGVVRSSAWFQHGSLSVLKATADGHWTMYNNAQNDFGSLKFGGTTAAFPSLKRSGTNLQLRLADDSTWGNLELATIVANNDVRAGAAALISWDTTRARMRSTADGVIVLLNAAETAFNRICLGGAAAGFPALKRNGVGIEARLGDDSAGTWYTGTNFNAYSNPIAVGAGTVSYGGSTAATVGAAGAAAALPAQPLGYININVAGTAAKIPYYNS